MRILGIELGGYSIKAVEIESRFRKFEILELHEIVLPPSEEDLKKAYQQKIHELFARLPVNPDKIVTSLPSTHVTLRVLSIPLKQKKKVEKAYRFELEDMVPFSIEESILEHQIIGDENGSLVLCALAPEKLVKSYLEWLQSIGIDPDWLTFDGMGILNLYSNAFKNVSQKNPESSCILVIDIGHISTKIIFFKDFKPCFFRNISWGGKNLTLQISNIMGISIEEAEKLKISSINMDSHKMNTSKEQQLYMIAEDILLSLVADINHSILAFRSKYSKQLSSVIITGGLTKLKGIESFLSKNLLLPVEKFAYFSQFGIRNETNFDQCSFGEVIGRALVFARKVPYLFNFRRHTVAKVSSLEELITFILTPNIKKILIYILIFLSALFIHVKIALYIQKTELSKKTDETAKLFQEVFGNVPTHTKKNLLSNPKDLEKHIEQKNLELTQKISLLSRNKKPTLELLFSFSRVFPKNIKVDVNMLSISDKSFSLEGVLYEGDILPVKKNLEDAKIFKKIDISVSDKRFKINGEIEGR